MVFTISNITSFLYLYLFHLLLRYLILNFDSLFRFSYTVITIQTLTTYLTKEIFFIITAEKEKISYTSCIFIMKNTHHIVAYRCYSKVYL